MKKIYEMILKTLKDSDIQDQRVSKKSLAKVIYYRLMIARLGEEDNNFWWESRILSSVGRINMVPFLPRTFYQQRLGMAQKSVRQKELSSISVNKVITLFHFGYEFENKVYEPAVNMLAERPEWMDILGELEMVEYISFDPHWARDFFNEPRLETFENVSGESYDLGSKRRHFYIHTEEIEEVIHNLISVYDYAKRGQVTIPYYKRVAVD
ncbi:BREX-6 system BrxE protein [Peribacillus frigoritolerans]|uniref:BREX-6 system BrxE protein n=1 Tax=Peribacillus frigoritolerans TaxID=450367 RepID=A0AAJ1VBS2_9BACI|nr:BREX-6 system BrxE protein [Peribacillus frigoritolerans]MDM5283765.1 BREX-6 system BrxE protein [Peribacillus frigoritolerans]